MLAVVTSLATTRPAVAEPPFAIRVRVAAAPSCTDEARVWAALRTRSDRLARADGSGPAGGEATIEIAVAETRGGTVGDLRIVRGGVRSDARRVTAASCSEAVSGLSLVAALAFDPAARIALESAPPSEVGDATLPASDGARTDAPGPAAVTSPLSRDAATADPPRAPPSRRAGKARARWSFGIGVNGGGLGLGTEPAFAWGGFLEAGTDGAGLSPSIRLGVTRTVSSAETPVVATDLGWTVARGSLSPVRVDLAPSLSLRPAIALEGGVLAAAARGFEGARRTSRPWAAVGLHARIAYAPTRRLFVEVGGGAVTPLVRDELVVEPTLSLYRAPVVVPVGEASLGLRFP